MDAIVLLLLIVSITLLVLGLLSPFWIPFVALAMTFWEMSKTDEQRMKKKEKKLKKERIKKEKLNRKKNESPKTVEMTKSQLALLEKIKKIDDPDILALLKDGAYQRVIRLDKTREPKARDAASLFATEVERLYKKARRLFSID